MKIILNESDFGDLVFGKVVKKENEVEIILEDIGITKMQFYIDGVIAEQW